MLILLYGEDTFRSHQKLNEIIKEYQAKHKTGLNLERFREEDLELEKIKTKIEAVSMFNEKKLLILENIFKNQNFSEKFFTYAKENKLKTNPEVIAVIYQEGKVLAGIKSKVNLVQEFKPLTNSDLANWLKKEISKNKCQINSEAVKRLIAYVSNDLWRMNNEIGKLVSYRLGGLIAEADVDLLVRAKIDVNIFKTLDALASRNKKIALKLLHEHLSEGENPIYLLTMFIYQMRNLIRLKDLVERGTPYQALAQKTKLHPFVIKKSWPSLQKFSLDQLKKIYQRLLEIDLGIKTGRFDGPTALDLLVAGI